MTELDTIKVSPDEKVDAANMFDPSLELLATLDHMTNVRQRLLNQKFKLLHCTLPATDMPYPMLVLCGPQGAGKMELAFRIVQDFHQYFGLGVSHTTRQAREGEVNGREYVFVAKEQFETMQVNGEFIETCSHAGHLYGLTFNAVEALAQEGLACVVCMELEGVMSLKKSYFEPRYVLVVPQSSQVHKERMRERGHYTEADITKALAHVDRCVQLHQERPGCFEQGINSDDMDEAYGDMKCLVMQYLALSNEPTPVSTSLGQYSSVASKGLTGTSQALAHVFSRPSSSSTSRIKSALEEQLHRKRVHQARATAAGPTSPPRHTVSAPATVAVHGDQSSAKRGTRDTSNVSLSAFQSLTTQNLPTPSSSEDISRSGSGLSGVSDTRGFSCSPISHQSQSPTGSATSKPRDHDLTNNTDAIIRSSEASTS